MSVCWPSLGVEIPKDMHLDHRHICSHQPAQKYIPHDFKLGDYALRPRIHNILPEEIAK